MIPKYAVIATRGRPDDLRTCIKSIDDQVDRIIVIDNNDEPESYLNDVSFKVSSFWHREQPPNLSKLWNFGLDIAADGVYGASAFEGDDQIQYDIAILNDDAIVPPGWFEAMSTAMRETGAAAASQHPFEGPQVVWGPDAVWSVGTRVTGWAFMLRGELGLRFDEQFQFWCGDDDMSVQARNSGGLVHVPGFPVQNTKANSSTTGLLAEIAAQDMQRFVDKHGRRPWW